MVVWRSYELCILPAADNSQSDLRPKIIGFEQLFTEFRDTYRNFKTLPSYNSQFKLKS